MNFKIKEARQIANISQKELAKVLGIAPATLSGYESGAHDPKSDILTKIADICGVSVDFLLVRHFVYFYKRPFYRVCKALFTEP